MTGHSGEFIGLFCCLKKEHREAGVRGEGSALIKLTVLLMSLGTTATFLWQQQPK